MSVLKLGALGCCAIWCAIAPLTAQITVRGTTTPQQAAPLVSLPVPAAAPIDTAKLLHAVNGCWNLTMGTYRPAIPTTAGPITWSELPNKIQLDTVRSTEKPDSAWRMKAAPSVSDSHPYDYFRMVSKDSVDLVFGGPKGVIVHARVLLDNMDGIAETYTTVKLDPASHAAVLLLRSSCR